MPLGSFFERKSRAAHEAPPCETNIMKIRKGGMDFCLANNYRGSGGTEAPPLT